MNLQVGQQILFEELEDLVDLINNIYGFDFGGYSRASLKRRVTRIMNLHNISYSGLKWWLVNKPHFFNQFLAEITVNVTEMFRDPGYYKSIRQNVLPQLSGYSKIKFWSAGCSTGEEVYSLGILLEEHKLSDRAIIYGTDINEGVLNIAKSGTYDKRKMKIYVENFEASCPEKSFFDYFSETGELFSVAERLKKNTLFSVHNLVSDGCFNEFSFISCRNVLIYFNVSLQEQVLKTFCDSLCRFGFLCLGSKETLRGEETIKRFRVVDKNNNIYQKIA